MRPRLNRSSRWLRGVRGDSDLHVWLHRQYLRDLPGGQWMSRLHRNWGKSPSEKDIYFSDNEHLSGSHLLWGPDDPEDWCLHFNIKSSRPIMYLWPTDHFESRLMQLIQTLTFVIRLSTFVAPGRFVFWSNVALSTCWLADPWYRPTIKI